jgi:hypothetical protein
MCDLFDLTQTLTQKFQRKNKDLDYLLFIDHIDDLLGDHSSLTFSNWHEDLAENGLMYHTFTKKLLPLPEKIISGFGKEELLDKNHCMIQIFKIPFLEEPTLMNLLKIGVYTGILSVNLKSSDFPEGIVKAYRDLKMHNLINFISRDEYTKMMEKMPDDIVKHITDSLGESF